jgi:RHS repeat-associated protein
VNNENLVTQDTSQPSSTDAYQYSPLNQICYAASSNSNACSAAPSGSEAYAYDGAGNLTSNNGTTQSYNANGELCWSVTGASTNGCATAPTGATRYSYDSDGNLSAETPSSGSATSLSYNGTNEMTQYQVGTSTPTSYAYDGDGLRMSKSSGGVDTSYAWDVSEAIPLLLEEETSGKITKYVYGPTGLPLEEILSSGKTYYYAHDGLGSTRVLSTSTGAVADTDAYGPYGAVTASTGTVQDKLLYAGQYLDGESGLYYMQARYYDPGTGQFTNVDPDLSSTGQPYEYAGDDPINQIDPTGLGFCLAGHNPNGSCRGSTEAEAVATSVSSTIGDVLQVKDIASLIGTCDNSWSSYACGRAIQVVGVDVVEDDLEILCGGKWDAVCSALLSAGGAWLLNRYGIKIPTSTPQSVSDVNKSSQCN